MNENVCCTLHFKICRLQLNLLQHQDDSLAIDHSEVVNSSTSNAQCVLQHGVCNVIGGCGILLPKAVFFWKYTET